MQIPINLRRTGLGRIFYGVGPETGPVNLVQRRVYILPTKMGLYFAVMMFIMLLGSVNYNNSLGFALTFLLASLSIVAILHTFRNLLHLRLNIHHVANVFCHETLWAAISIDNQHKHARYSLQLGFPHQSPVIVDISADQQVKARLSLQTQTRGEHALPRVTIRTSFPLNLFTAWAHIQFDKHYLVYAEPDAHHPLPQKSSAEMNLSGDRGRGTDDFAGLRHYLAGDSLRHIHWKAVARGQGLHTKQFGGDQADEIHLDWSALGAELDIEQRLSRLTRWVIDAEAAQLRYRLSLPGKQIPLGDGPDHRHRCLKALALFQVDKTLPADPAS